MTFRTACAGALALLCLLGVQLAAQEPAASRLIPRLVEDLGAREYDDRERATEMLRRIGAPALRALRQGLDADNEEMQIRAARILGDWELGISPDWPADLIVQARHYDQVIGDKRKAVVTTLANSLREEAIPFLILRGSHGTSAEAAHCLGTIEHGLGTPRTARRVIELIEKPANEFEIQLLTWAHYRLGDHLRAALVPAEASVTFPLDNEGAAESLAEIRKLLRARRHDAALQAARAGRAKDPADPRFHYLEADVLDAQDKKDDARTLRQAALAVETTSQTPHVLAARMLEATGEVEFALAQWDLVRRKDPADSALDVYAALRACDMHAAAGRFAEAARAATEAAETIARGQAAGHNMGLIGTLAGGVKMIADENEALARKYPGEKGVPRKVSLPAEELRAEVQSIVMDADGKSVHDTFRRVLFLVKKSLTYVIDPPGADLLSADPSLLRYDLREKQLHVLYRDIPCSQRVPFDAGDKPAPIVVYVNDAVHLYVVEPNISRPLFRGTYEKDYKVRFVLGPRLSAYTDLCITLDGLPYELTELTRGLNLDVLPDAFDVAIEGTSPDGERQSMRLRLKLEEPAIEPVDPGQPEQGEPNIEDILRPPAPPVET